MEQQSSPLAKTELTERDSLSEKGYVLVKMFWGSQLAWITLDSRLHLLLFLTNFFPLSSYVFQLLNLTQETQLLDALLN